MPGETIDAIRVGLGIDVNELRSQLATARADFDKQIPTKRTVLVNVRVSAHLDQSSLKSLYESVTNSFRNLQQQGGNDPKRAMIIRPRLAVDQRTLREFRLTTEKALRQEGISGRPIHIPIKAAFTNRQFRQEIVQQLGGFITIPIKGQWDGWAGGNKPPNTGGGGGGGATPSTGATSGGGAARPATARPATTRARAAIAPSTPASRAPSGRGYDVPSSDRYEVGDEPSGARSSVVVAPVVRTRAPAGAPSPREQQRSARRNRAAAGAVPPPPAGTRAPTNSYGPDPARRTVGATVTPGYVEPEGGRVDVGNVRSGSAIPELQGEERASYIAQGRARPTRPERQFRQAGEPVLTGMEKRDQAFRRDALERLARRQRYQASVARGQSPADIAAREQVRSGFHQLDPDLGALFDQLSDPEGGMSFDKFLSAAERSREAYSTAFHGMDKKTRRGRAVARGYKKGDINAVDPSLLLFDAALDAARAFAQNQIDPLFAVRSGDNKLRGKGGKVGRIGSRNAGRLASRSVEPSETEKKIEKERRRASRPVTPIPLDPNEPTSQRLGPEFELENEEIVDGVRRRQYTHTGRTDIPSVPGGQGLTRGTGIKPNPRDIQDIDRPHRGIGDIMGLGARDQSRYAQPRPSSTNLSPFGRFLQRRGFPVLRFAEGGLRVKRNWGVNDYMRGLYGREIGQGFGAPEGHVNVASTNSYEWKKARRAQLSRQPFCAHCGISISEARGIGERMTAEHSLSQAQGGAAMEPDLTLCGSCNSRKSGSSATPDVTWTHPRPNVRAHPKLGILPEAEFLPHGSMFGITGIREALSRLKNRAEGGTVERLVARGGGISAFDVLSQMGMTGQRPKRKPAPSAWARPTDKDDAWGHDRNEHDEDLEEFRHRFGYANGGMLGRSQWKWGKGYAEGGYVKHGGLLDRMAQAGHQPSITMVGERGPELLVTGPNGETEVVPTHKVPTWLARAQQGQGLAKDMTHRDTGGLGPDIQYRGGGASGRAHWVSGASAAGQAVQQGLASAMGPITRVVVTNWPPMLASAQGFAQAQGQAARAAPRQAAAASPGPGVAGAAAGPGPAPGPGAGVPGGAPAPGAGRARRGVISAYDRVRNREIRFSGEQREGSLASQNVEVGANISEAIQKVPARALSVSVGQIFQNTFGNRADILRRATRARVAVSRANRAEAAYGALREQGADIRTRLANIQSGATQFDNPADRQATLDDLTAQYKGNVAGRREARDVAQQRSEQATQAAGGIVSRGQQLRSQAAGLGGIVAGGALFNLAINATSAAATAGAAALDPFIQALTGFPGAVDKATSSLRDSITSMRGQTSAGIAAAVAPSGISARYLDQAGGAFGQTGINRAAETAAAQALDITRANRGLNGGARGLYEGTGGLFGSNALTEVFGGQPGFLQDIEKRLQVNARTLDTTTPANTGFLGQFPNDAARYQSARQRQANPGLFESVGDRTDDKQFITEFERNQAGPAKQQQVIEDLNKNLASAAKYAGDAAGAFKLVANANDEQKKAMIESAKSISEEARTRAEGIAATGVAVVGPGEANLTGRQFDQYAQQQARGQLIQNPELLLRASAPQRRAQAFQLAQSAQFARQEDIPANFALQRLANPPLRFGTTFSTRGLAQAETTTGQAASSETFKNIANYTKMAATASISSLTAERKGTAALEKIVSRIDQPTLAGGIQETLSGPGGRIGQAGQAGPALTRFREITGQIGGLGQDIAGITEGLNLRQTNLQVAEYSNQIRITKRSLGDARDIWAAINGDVRKTLGGMQGQNMVLDRQNQLLGRRSQQLSFKSEDLGFQQSDIGFRMQERGFNQTQRQINFSVATAGFQAPGGSPEERSARIAEAKIEAQFAQDNLTDQRAIAELAKQQLSIAKEQQGLSKQQFGNQTQQQDNAYAIQVEEVKRSITDLEKDLENLEAARAITIDSAAAEETIARLREQQGLLIEEAQSYVEQGNSVRSGLLSDTASLMAETGAAIDELISGVQQAWSTAFRDIQTGYDEMDQRFGNALPGEPLTPEQKRAQLLRTLPGGGNDKRQGGGGNAAGGIHHVTSPTRFLAGEAGSEHVIVLRNPKASMGMNLPSGMGGGGGTSFAPTININGATVRNDNDLAAIRTIVEDTMNKAAAQFLRFG